MGASLGFTQPLTMSLMVESVAAELCGVALGIRQGVQRLGAILSPMVFGVVTAAFRIEWAFFLGSAALLGAVPIVASVTGHLGSPPRPGHAPLPASNSPPGAPSRSD